MYLVNRRSNISHSVIDQLSEQFEIFQMPKNVTKAVLISELPKTYKVFDVGL